MADGGEGTMDTLVKALHGEWKECEVCGPLRENVRALYGLLPGNKAVIEMAQASGLPLIPNKLRNAAKTTSFGTGMLIRDALDMGIRDITIAIGGSATNDGGIGAMQALGIKFLDEYGNNVEGCGESLGKIRNIDISDLHKAVVDTKFTVICDVTNTLLGKNGATYVFGPQKVADEETLKKLEIGMVNYSDVTKTILGKDFCEIPGSGAAGGLGFALMAFLGAELMSGIDTVLDLLDFEEKLKGVNLVITGEGRMDGQSCLGKVPSGVGKRCKKVGIPDVAVVGGLMPDYESIYECGIESVITTINCEMDLEYALAHSKALYLDAAKKLLRMIKYGINI